MLMPKRVKHRKHHRGRMRGMATRGNKVEFGDYALMALEPAWISSRQIEAARIAMTRHIKRGGQVWIRVFPDKPFTKKPLEQRMGKGKAPVEGWVAVVKPGRILFEMDGVPVEIAKEAMRLAKHKLPIDCKFVTRADFAKGHPLGIYLRTPVQQRVAKLNEPRAHSEVEAAPVEALEASVDENPAATHAGDQEPEE